MSCQNLTNGHLQAPLFYEGVRVTIDNKPETVNAVEIKFNSNEKENEASLVQQGIVGLSNVQQFDQQSPAARSCVAEVPSVEQTS